MRIRAAVGGRRRIVLLAGLALLASAASAQGPGAAWRTLATEHFQVHYTEPAEVWARRSASRLESAYELVAREVGYAPPEIVDVVVADPTGSANGTAWPITGRPRMVLWTSPPGPASVIGHYRDWTETLTVHEQAHLAHLLRPSRNRLERWAGQVVPIGPIARRSPRWLSEGYATYLEGRLTGHGRPHSDLRATILRRWAQLGELPSYGRLNADSGSWLGMSMAYLVGSAFLEWLVEREGPESLRHLWARMSARQARSFGAAFAGVYGDAPAKLYNRFRAELTYRAMQAEALVEPRRVEGELWQDLAWTTGAPVVSPGGERLAIVLRSREGPSRLVVWSVEDDEEAEERWRQKRREIAERDPEDVPAVRRKPLPRDPLFELPSPAGGAAVSPRFMPDGQAILFVRYVPDAAGSLHPDLFRWHLESHLESGRVRRLTWRADVRDPDPAPSGEWAVAVRHRHGRSQLVRVELASGRVEPLTEASLDDVYHHPRISPDGTRLVFVRHRRGAWRLVLRQLASGVERELATPPRATVAHPAWSPDGTALFAAVGAGGFIDLWRFDVESGASRRVTRGHGAALSPAPTPDGESLFYLGLEAGGLDLRRLELDAAAPSSADLPPILAASLAPAVRVEPEAEIPLPRPVEVGEDRPYGAGRQELFPVLGGTYAPSGRGWEAGLRAGDVVGRLELLALAGGGDGVPRGSTAGAVWRGFSLGGERRGALSMDLRLFSIEERPSEQPTTVPGLGRLLDLERDGLELGLEWTHRRRASGLRARLGVAWSSLETADDASLDQALSFLRIEHRSRQRIGSWRFEQGLGLMADWGETEGDGWTRAGGKARFSAGHELGALAVAWSRREASGAALPIDRLQLGGVAGSLLPPSLAGGRIFVPALPAGTRTGDDHEGQRLELRWNAWPVTFFYERHRLWSDGSPVEGWLALRGAELSFSQGPLPLLRLPAVDLSLGVAEILDPPFEGEWEGWLSLAWRLERVR